jgi:hypothetical protein
MNIQESIGALFGSLSFVVGIALVVFWMVVAWRAMRAHERIADAWERSNPAKSEVDAEAVKPCASCGKTIPKSFGPGDLRCSLVCFFGRSAACPQGCTASRDNVSAKVGARQQRQTRICKGAVRQLEVLPQW